MSPIIADCQCQEPVGGGGGPAQTFEIEWFDYLTELTPESGPPSAPYNFMVGGPMSLTINNVSATNTLGIFVTVQSSSFLIDRSAYSGELFLSRSVLESGSLIMSFGGQQLEIAPSLWTSFDPGFVVPSVTLSRAYSISISSSVTIEMDEQINAFYDDGTGSPLGITILEPARISVIAVPE